MAGEHDKHTAANRMLSDNSECSKEQEAGPQGRGPARWGRAPGVRAGLFGYEGSSSELGRAFGAEGTACAKAQRREELVSLRNSEEVSVAGGAEPV